MIVFVEMFWELIVGKEVLWAFCHKIVLQIIYIIAMARVLKLKTEVSAAVVCWMTK
jgi:hypothetical protein